MASPKKQSRKSKRVAGQTEFRATTPERVCILLRQGHALRTIAALKNMPTLDTLSRWLTEDAEFRAQYDRAREAQREIFADDVVALADSLAGSSAAGTKLRIDARKWRVALMDKEIARKSAKDTGPLNDELIERLEAAHKRVAEFNASRASSDDTTMADSATADRDEPGTGLHRPEDDAFADAGDDTAGQGDGNTWTIAFPEDVGGGVVSGDKPDADWWR